MISSNEGEETKNIKYCAGVKLNKNIKSLLRIYEWLTRCQYISKERLKKKGC